MSKPAFTIQPIGKRHILESYKHKLCYSLEPPEDLSRAVRLGSNLYVWFVDDIHEWFTKRQISYNIGHNRTVGFFVRVPKQHFLMAKLTWGG